MKGSRTWLAFTGMLLVGVAPVMAALGPFYAGVWGWRTAVPHTIFAGLMALLLIEVLLLRLDKIPFTCTYLPGKANLRVMIIPYLFAFTTYSYSMTALELRLMRNPASFATFICAAFLLLVAAVARRNRRLRQRGSFVYEINPLPAAEPLRLTQQ